MKLLTLINKWSFLLHQLHLCIFTSAQIVRYYTLKATNLRITKEHRVDFVYTMSF